MCPYKRKKIMKKVKGFDGGGEGCDGCTRK